VKTFFPENLSFYFWRQRLSVLHIGRFGLKKSVGFVARWGVLCWGCAVHGGPGPGPGRGPGLAAAAAGQYVPRLRPAPARAEAVSPVWMPLASVLGREGLGLWGAHAQCAGDFPALRPVCGEWGHLPEPAMCPPSELPHAGLLRRRVWLAAGFSGWPPSEVRDEPPLKRLGG